MHPIVDRLGITARGEGEGRGGEVGESYNALVYETTYIRMDVRTHVHSPCNTYVQAHSEGLTVMTPCQSPMEVLGSSVQIARSSAAAHRGDRSGSGVHTASCVCVCVCVCGCVVGVCVCCVCVCVCCECVCVCCGCVCCVCVCVCPSTNACGHMFY